MSDENDGYADLSEGVPSRRPAKLRSKADAAPEAVDRMATEAERHAQAQGYAPADPDGTAPTDPERRLHITVPESVHDQIRRRMFEAGERSMRTYILRILRDAGEIEVDDTQLRDRRGEWMRKAFKPRS